MIVPGIFFIHMPDCNKICKIPVDWSRPTNDRILFNIGDYTIGCSEYRSIFWDYEIYCVSKVSCVGWRGRFCLLFLTNFSVQAIYSG